MTTRDEGPRTTKDEGRTRNQAPGPKDLQLPTQAHNVAAEVARRSYGKLVAFLAARTRDVAAAEDALSEAFAAALLDWPAKEIPSSPEAWLLAVARRWMIDAARRQRTVEHAGDDLRLISEEIEAVADSRSDIP